VIGAPAMPDLENASVVFRLRFGKEAFTCKGRLAREGGILYAVIDEMPDDCPFPPDRVKLEEDSLELRHDPQTGDYYQYHGFIFIY
jgi:hypothetical protein